MAGMLKNMKNAMSYLGMADVSEADDRHTSQRSTRHSQTASDDRSQRDPVDQDQLDQSIDDIPSDVRESEYDDDPEPQARIVTIHPQSYNDAQQIGIAIRQGTPVVLNLTDLSDAVAYRIVDFSAGVVFGLRGAIERITPKVFLLSPANISISVAQTSRRNNSGNLFNED